METNRFRDIARSLAEAPSRRGLVQLLAAAGLVAALGSDATAGKGKKKPCQPKCKVCQKCRRGKCKPSKKQDRKPCADGKVCERGRCVPERCGNGGPCRVFMTNAGQVGSEIGGLEGGDAFCQQTAEDAELSGTFRAWLSAGNDSPSNRFTKRAKAGPYLLVPNEGDGGNPPPTVAVDFADLTSCNGVIGVCLQNPINRTEDGVAQGGLPAIWTGTETNGTTAADTCGGWTAAGNGVSGIATAVNEDWTNFQASDCQAALPLYCFEQA